MLDNEPLIDSMYRVRHPQDTLEIIQPKLAACGITRVADVTGLDRVGIPTCCAIRPSAAIMQVTNGKGITKVAAQVSALMESIELFHAEDSAACQGRFCSQTELQHDQLVAAHQNLPSFDDTILAARQVKQHWVETEELLSGGTAWMPKSAIFFDQNPAIHKPTTNGLASGNHITEASLHALYEVIERDAGSRLFEDGRLALKKRGQVIDPDSIEMQPIKNLLARVSQQSRVVICSVESIVDVYTFWVILLNNIALSSLTTLNIGWGTHSRKEVALSRALTEAAQSRLTHIHGAREDIIVQAGYHNANVKSSAAYRYFDSLQPTHSWQSMTELEREPGINLAHEWNDLLQALSKAGFDQILRYDLTRADIGIPVVKILVPGLLFNQKLF